MDYDFIPKIPKSEKLDPGAPPGPTPSGMKRLIAFFAGFVAFKAFAVRSSLLSESQIQSDAEGRFTMLQEGTRAPAFSLPDDRNRQVSLKDYAGDKIVVLFFFPKADTPG